MKTIEFDYNNRPGISRIYAIPVTSFLRIRKDYKKQTDFLEVKNRDEIIEIPVHTGTFLFTESQTTEEAGETFNVAIDGCIPKLSMLNDAIVRKLERGEWLILHQDNNGTIHLSGSVDDPLNFHSSKSTGSGAEAVNGNAFKFSGITPDSSLIIDMPMLTEL